MQIVAAPAGGSWVVIACWTGLANRYAVLNLRTEEQFDCADRHEAVCEARRRNDLAASQPAPKHLLNAEHRCWCGTRVFYADALPLQPRLPQGW